MRLNTIYSNSGSHKKSKRVGRGIGSGKGKTCGSGVKGQKARSGVAIKGFEGGQMPINRRLPKRGFTNIFRVEYDVVNFSVLEKFIANKKLSPSKITKAKLFEVGILNKENGQIKLLAKGKLTQKIEIEVDKVSKSAEKIVTDQGGKVILIQKSVVKKQDKKSTTKKDVAVA